MSLLVCINHQQDYEIKIQRSLFPIPQLHSRSTSIIWILGILSKQLSGVDRKLQFSFLYSVQIQKKTYLNWNHIKRRFQLQIIVVKQWVRSRVMCLTPPSTTFQLPYIVAISFIGGVKTMISVERCLQGQWPWHMTSRNHVFWHKGSKYTSTKTVSRFSNLNSIILIQNSELYKCS